MAEKNAEFRICGLQNNVQKCLRRVDLKVAKIAKNGEKWRKNGKKIHKTPKQHAATRACARARVRVRAPKSANVIKKNETEK